jgi:hypothetical protein
MAFGNGIQVSGATLGETFFVCLMDVVSLLNVASARRIADGLLECLARVAREAPSDRNCECGPTRAAQRAVKGGICG